MPHIANTGRIPIVLPTKSGEHVTILPNEAVSADVDKEDPIVAGHATAGTIVIGGSEKQARETARNGVAPGAVAASQPTA